MSIIETRALLCGTPIVISEKEYSVKKLMQLFIKVFNPIQQFPGHAMLTV